MDVRQLLDSSSTILLVREGILDAAIIIVVFGALSLSLLSSSRHHEILLSFVCVFVCFLLLLCLQDVVLCKETTSFLFLFVVKLCFCIGVNT